MPSRHFLSFLTLFALLLPAASAPPAWWTTGNPPIINGSEVNNKGPANIGQAKWMVSEALRALDTAAPAIATQIRADLAGTAPAFTDRILDLAVPSPKTADWTEKQKAPLLVGQLKAIAAPFYNRLHAQPPPGSPPSAPPTPRTNPTPSSPGRPPQQTMPTKPPPLSASSKPSSPSASKPSPQVLWISTETEYQISGKL